MAAPSTVSVHTSARLFSSGGSGTLTGAVASSRQHIHTLRLFDEKGNILQCKRFMTEMFQLSTSQYFFQMLHRFDGIIAFCIKPNRFSRQKGQHPLP